MYNSFVHLQQPVTPVVQIPEATRDVGVADVLIGSIGLIGLLTILAVLAGLAAGAAFILYRRWQDAHATDAAEDDHTRLRLSA
jgi:hypothetical protein